MLTEIGQLPWSTQDMLDKLEEFAILNEDRPIKRNGGGMLSPHTYLMWFVLQYFKPSHIIESGVFRGQGTWFIEKACPNAHVYCLDINFSPLFYFSPKAQYFKMDFTQIDWSELPREDTIIFWDDHQNALERVKLCEKLGFKRMMFEDNYPKNHGDCYSLKKAFYNEEDSSYLHSVLKLYSELPPIFKVKQWRGCPWDFPTTEPLLKEVEHLWQEIFFTEAKEYTCLCYVELK